MSRLPPSKRKLEKARKEGKTVKSQMLSGAIAAAAMLGCGLAVASFLVNNKIMLEYLLTMGAAAPGVCLAATAGYFALLAGGVLALGALVAAFFEWWRVRIVFSWGALAPDLSRLSPAAGAARVLSGLGLAWLTLLKLMVLGALFAWLLYGERELFAAAVFNAGTFSAADLFFRAAAPVAATGGSAIVLLGVLEYQVNRAKFMRELEMSRVELQQEMKEDEGDPLVRAQRRMLHREISYRALVHKIRRSRVVVVERV